MSVSSAALSSIFSFAALTASTFAPGASYSLNQPIAQHFPIQHPFLWLWSWVEWSPRQMDVLLTAVCCCLVPTPVNSHVRAHNLLQVSSISLNDWGDVSKNRMNSILFGKDSGAFCLYQPLVTACIITGSILQPRLQQAYCPAKWGHNLFASWVLATFSS